MTDYRLDNESIAATCYFIDDDCPRCGYVMASNGYLDWCANDDVCGYSRKTMSAPLDSQNDDPDFDGAGLA